MIYNYINENRNKDFDVGIHDCFTFTNGAWNAMHGKGYADKFIGKYCNLNDVEISKVLFNLYGHIRIKCCINKLLKPINGVPPKGALVAMINKHGFDNYGLGVCMGVNSVFVGKKDLVFYPTSKIDGAWI